MTWQDKIIENADQPKKKLFNRQNCILISLVTTILFSTASGLASDNGYSSLSFSFFILTLISIFVAVISYFELN